MGIIGDIIKAMRYNPDEMGSNPSERLDDPQFKEYRLEFASGVTIAANSVEKLRKLDFKSGHKRDLILVRMGKVEYYGDVEYLRKQDYVAFEVQRDEKITDEIIEATMKEYERRQRSQQEQQIYYIGNLIKKENHSLGFQQGTDEVRQTLLQMLRGRGVEAPVNDFKQKLQHVAKAHQAKLIQERAARKRDPYLKLIEVQKEATTGGNIKAYRNYKGVNLETGDILQLRRVDSIGMDGEGMHLYTAYIQNTPEENETGKGFPICFELPESLREIVKTGDIEEIKNVLSLLSDSRNCEDAEQLKYIGRIDQNWQIIRSNVPSSETIQRRVKRMQMDFQGNDQGIPK